MIAIEHGAETMVSRLLAQSAYDEVALGVMRGDGMSAFLAAVCGSHRNILDALIDAGVDLDEEPRHAVQHRGCARRRRDSRASD
jgi:hypothetical protein